MKCIYCGAEIPADLSACLNCGANYPSPATPVHSQTSLDPDNSTPRPPKKRKTGLVIIITLLLVIALLVIGFFTIHFGPEVSCTADSECILCGKIMKEAPGHEWNNASCTVPKTCKVCGTTKGDSLEHQWLDATCTTPKTCENCGTTDGAVSEHQWLDATCTAPKTCENCGITDGAVSEHQWGPYNCSTPPVCTECGVIGDEIGSHVWQNPTCTEPKTCSACGTTEGYPNGHSWLAATTNRPQTCSVCGTTIGTPVAQNGTYLCEMECWDKYGKLWIRSENPLFDYYHSDADDLDVWEQYSIPGNTVGAVFDNQGNRYKYGLHVDGSDIDEYYVSYYLGGKYTKFTAWCGFPATPLSVNAVYSEKYVEFRGDGRFLDSTSIMKKNSMPEYIELDVTGVQVLTIRYPASAYNNEAATIFDAMVS